MPEFNYRGRDREGKLRIGQRAAISIDNLNTQLIKEGISPISITPLKPIRSFWENFQQYFQSRTSYLQDLSTFARQMQLLYQAGVPLITSLHELARYARSRKVSKILLGVVDHLEKGESLAASMKNFPELFSPLMINLVQIGESTGHLDQAFSHLNRYLEFEISSIKQVKTSFRYPMFVTISILAAIIILNIFVIPTFAQFYKNVTVSLPWQTSLLIGMSDFTVNYGLYLLILLAGLFVFFFYYIKTPLGRFRFDKFKLRIPVLGNMLKRIITIRFCQLLSITISSGMGITQGLGLVKQAISNSFIVDQISKADEAIESGIPFTQSISKIELFSPLEYQILAVGEKNGKLDAALDYIAEFHGREIEFDLKRLSDVIGPVLISAIAILILIIALGVYLPIWNMVNINH